MPWRLPGCSFALNMFVWIAGLVWLKCIDERFERSVQKALEPAGEVVGSYYHRQVI